MKKLILMVIFVGIAKIGFGQSISLGNDTTFCSIISNPKIGTKLTISGSTLNITYNWSSKYILGNITSTAINFLDNITTPSPIVTNLPYNVWVRFVLTASQNGNILKDSINIRVSNFIYTTSYLTKYLFTGDSIEINKLQIGGGINPIKFKKWEPANNVKNHLTNPAFFKQTLTSVGQSLQVYGYITDSVGCEGSAMSYDMKFQNTSKVSNKDYLDSEVYIKNGILNYPNPLNENVDITIFDTFGKLLLSKSTYFSCLELYSPLYQSDEILLIAIKYKKSKLFKKIKIIIP